jgi:predicted nucleic acid-binding protein
VAFLLDSDWMIDRLADRPRAVELVRRLAPAGLAVSVVSYMEAFQGLDRDPDPEAAETRLRLFLSTVLLLPVTPEIARRCALVRRDLRRRGRRVNTRALDLLIAATAIEHGLALVTRNLGDYRDVPGLRLYEAEVLP